MPPDDFARKPAKSSSCDLCGREKPLSFHHLIPKKNHRKTYFRRRYSQNELVNSGLWLCRACHRKLHQTFSEKELGLQFNSKQALLAQPDIQTFLRWVRKQK